MRKKLIRLTESDLHKIVENSVKKCLTELDWKTYMNASKGREKQGNDESSKELEDYANKKFSEKHGLDNGWMGDEHNDNQFKVSKHSGQISNRMNGGKLNKYIYNDNQTWNRDTPDAYRADRSFNDKLGRATNDMRGYYNQYLKTDYKKGKGWEN